MSVPSASETAQRGSTDRKSRRLRYKQHLKAGTWNVKNGISSPRQRDLVLKTAKDLGIDILAIPEAALAGFGIEPLAGGYVLLWSDPGAEAVPPRCAPPPGDTHVHNNGVAILLNPYAASALASWEARVAKATWDNRGDNAATATGDVGADG